MPRKLSLIQSSHPSRLKGHEGHRPIMKIHINTLDVFLKIRSKSSHSVLEKGTTLSVPDIKLSVCGMTAYKSSAGEKNLDAYIVPCQSFNYILQGQFRWPNVRWMKTEIIPITATMPVNCKLLSGLGFFKYRFVTHPYECPNQAYKHRLVRTRQDTTHG
jgi:hypothetical protein